MLTGRVYAIYALTAIATMLAACLPVSSHSAKAASPIEVLSEGNDYFLKVSVRDSRVQVRTTVANNDSGGYQSLAGMKSRYENKGYAEWAIVNADYFGGGCPSNVNCAEGLTYIDGARKDNWSQNGDTWKVRGNIGFDGSKDPQISIGDAQTKRNMVVAGGPWIVKDGGPPTCSAQYVDGVTYFSTGEQFKGPNKSGWCTNADNYTLVGYDADHSHVFIGVSTGGKTLLQVAQWLKDKGAHEILKLDSGSSTGMYHNGTVHGNGDKAIADALAITVSNDPPPPPPGQWRVSYFKTNNLGDKAFDATEAGPYLFHDWDNGGPGNGVPTDNFSAEFAGDFDFSAGDYRFYYNSDDGIRICLDGCGVFLDKWNAGERGSVVKSISGGRHQITVQYREFTGGAHVEVWWEGPGYSIPHDTADPNQWYGEFVGNQRLDFNPTMVGVNQPGPTLIPDNSRRWGLPQEHVSARFKRTINTDCGIYVFTISHDDGARLSVDGTSYYSNWSDGVFIGRQSQPVKLTSGPHQVSIEYYQNIGGAQLSVQWNKTGSCPNQPPVANAGPDQTVTDTDGDGFASVTLDGRASSDPDGDPLTFVWADGSTELQSRAATITVSLSVGAHNIQLYVGDPDLASDTDEVKITVNPKPSDPPNVTLKLEVGVYDLTDPYPDYTAYGPFNPTHLDRQLTLQVVGEGAAIVTTLHPTVHFDATKKAYTANVPVHLDPGTYYVKVKLSNTLRQTQIGTFTVDATTTSVTIPRIKTMIGDIDGNNRVDINDYNILIGCYSVLSPPKSCSAAHLPTSGGEPTTDLDDDGDVDQADYNLLLRKFQILLGD